MTQGLAGYTGVRFPTSRIGFNEAQYLASNPDVALMVQQGLYPSAQAHYETVGRLEGRVPLTGGNQGQTVAAGLQRYYNNLGLNGQSPFTQTPTTPGTPAAQPTDPAQAVAAAPPVPYTPVGAGGGSEGLAYDQTSAPTTGINTNAGKSLGSLGQIGGAMLGVPLVGAGLTALGTKFDVDAANATLAENNRVAQANNPTVNYWDALKNNLSFGMLGMGHNAQAQRALEQQREHDRAKGFSSLPRPGGSYEDAANEAAASYASRVAEMNEYNNEASERAAAESRAAAAEAAAQAAQAAAASETAGMDFGGGGGGGWGGDGGGFDARGSDGGGYGGDAGTSDGSDSGSFNHGGFIRALYAMGGLAKPKKYAAGGSANIMPWDRVNADADAQGLAAWSPYEASSAPLDAGAPIVGAHEHAYANGGLLNTGRRLFNILGSGRRLADEEVNAAGRLFRERTPGEERVAPMIRSTAEYARGQAKAGAAGAGAALPVGAGLMSLYGGQEKTYPAILTPPELEILGLPPELASKEIQLSASDMDRLSQYFNQGSGYAQGGLSAVQPGNNPIHAAMGTQVAGPGDGRSDNVPAMLSADEYVIPADVVAALGDGSSNAGAKVLADLVVSTRDRYRRKLGSLPPPKA